MVISPFLLFVLFILVILNSCFISARKYNLVIVLVIILLTFISKEENGLITGISYSTGGQINLSIVGYDIIIAALLSVMLGSFAIKIKGKNTIVSILCIIILFSLRFAVDGLSFFSNKLMDNYLLPLVLSLLMIKYIDTVQVVKIVKLLYICIFFNSIIGCIEYFVGKSLFFHNYYMQENLWYQSIFYAQNYGLPFRCTALLGHPLTNGMFYLMGLVILFNNDKSWNFGKVLQFAILFFALFATNSRAALLVIGIYICYYLISNKKPIKIIILFITAVITIFLINIDDVYGLVFKRDESGSSLMVRVLTILNFNKIPFKYILFGTGYNNSLTTTLKYVGNTNLEISYLIMLLENGIFGFVIWIIALLSIYSNSMPPSVRGYKYAHMIKGMLICYLLYAGTSSSFSDPGTLVYLLCMILAFSKIGEKDINNVTQNRQYR